MISDFNIPKTMREEAFKTLVKHFDRRYCKQIEHGVYDYVEQYCKGNRCLSEVFTCVYTHIIDNIVYNCQDDNETMTNIKKGMDDKLFNPYNIAYLKPDELNRGNWLSIIMRMINTEERLANLPTVEWRPCKSCKEDKYFCFQLQTRSGDEPETCFYICKKCKRTYRINN
jgi:DNA-directed RNA polymerase subunit M/transcription elongation factor TFIIS